VGVKDGLIVWIGDIASSAASVINAFGKIVAPGLIDVHSAHRILRRDR
jgi:N-acyl-D-aspartate/D-glutamate deacylase